MLALIFILPLIAALLCLALDRVVATRWLALGAAVVLIIDAIGLLVARLRFALPLTLPDYTWSMLSNRPLLLALRFDAADWPFVLLVLGGSGLVVLALALAIPPDLRGFGGLFAVLLFGLLVTIVGLMSEDRLFLPFAWTLLAALDFVALRASGALVESDAPLIVLLGGMFGALVLVATALAPQVSSSATASLALVLGGGMLAGMLATGAPPFHATVESLAHAPAALAGALLPLGLPLLGGYALIRCVAELGAPIAPPWQLVLTGLGILTLLVCAAGSLSATQARDLVGWEFSAQLGFVFVAVAQGGATLTAVAPALLLNAALATLVCLLAVAVMERYAGSDALNAITVRRSLLLPGLAFLIGTASTVGLPGTWGMWPRYWLLEAVLRNAPWALPPLLGGSALLALAAVAPLAAFLLDPQGQSAPQRSRLTTLTLVIPAIAALPLLILGISPQLLWNGWLRDVQTALVPASAIGVLALPQLVTQLLMGVAALGLIAVPLIVRRYRTRQALSDSDMRHAGVFTPQALAQSLRGLVWLGTPIGIFQLGWEGVLALGSLLRRSLALFEQRYYLAGLLIAIIVIVMLFIQ